VAGTTLRRLEAGGLTGPPRSRTRDTLSIAMSADAKLSDVTGQAVNSSGGLWYVVSSAGSVLTTVG